MTYSSPKCYNLTGTPDLNNISLLCNWNHANCFFHSSEAVKNEEGLRFDIHGESPDAQTLTITNEGKLECTLKRIEGPDHSQKINLQLGPGQSQDVLIEGLDLNHDGARPSDDTQAPAEYRLIVSAKRMTDFCFPRSHAVLRHGAQRISDD